MRGIGEFKLTKHAVERALDMGVDPEEIRQCLLNPETVASSHHHRGENYRRGRIACAVRNNHVITIVWSSPEQWQRDIESAGEYDGRQYRGA